MKTVLSRQTLAAVLTFAFVPAFVLMVLPFAWSQSVAPSATRSPAPTQVAPSVSSLLKPAILKKVTEDRYIQTFADLEQVEGDSQDPPLQRYSFYSAMLVRAGVARTRKVLTDYKLYSELVPYIDETNYSPTTRNLLLKGGIWKFKLASVVHFDEIGDRWIRFQIIQGHFAGLSGDIFFEPQGENGTLVFMRGSQQGHKWPPAFILERGAEIVFEFTAKRMRSYVEGSQGSGRSGDSHVDPQVPQPRSRL